MKRSTTTLCASLFSAVVGIALVGLGGCGGNSGGGDGGSTYESSELSQFSRPHVGRVHSQTGTDSGGLSDGGVDFVSSGTAPTGASTTATPAATGSATSPTDIQAAIAAAQSPDGTAIPQGPGPNGECPQVLVLLGFWSCPQIGETCSYAALGVTHHCACDRIDGEGGMPAWVCDQ